MHDPKLFASIAVAMLLGVPGCAGRPAAPLVLAAAKTVEELAPGVRMTGFQWPEGLTIVFIDDLKGVLASSDARPDDQYVITGSACLANADVPVLKWQIKTGDGKSARCDVNGKDYDLTDGKLFLFKEKNKAEVDVHQLKRDLSDREVLKKDAEILKIFGPSIKQKK